MPLLLYTEIAQRGSTVFSVAVLPLYCGSFTVKMGQFNRNIQIASKIKSGLEPNKICILCKQKPASYTERIISELKKFQIYARVEDDYQNLIKESIVEMLISILRLAVDIKHPHDWEYVVLKTSELWNIASYQSNEDYLEMQDALDVEIQLLGSMMKNVASKSEFQGLLRHVIEFWGGSRIKANFPVYGQGTYLEEVLTKFRDYMWNELESTGKDWLLAIEKFEGLHSVPIMTIHKSKGLEYDAVYFVGLEDSAFWGFKNQPEEDRCAFFVALSRAKKEIFFTFCQYRYTSRFPKQKHDDINEFFELLKIPGMANIIE